MQASNAAQTSLGAPTLVGTLARPWQYQATALFCALILLVSSAVRVHGRLAGPVLPEIVPLISGACIVAELATAVLLYTQYYATGASLLLAAGMAYALAGLLNIPFVLTFPGFVAPQGLGAQTAVWFFVLALDAFAGMIVFYPGVLRTFSEPSVIERPMRRIIGSAVVVVGLSAILSALLIVYRDQLPVLMINNRPQPFFQHVVLPVCAVLGFAAIVRVLGPVWRRDVTTFQLVFVIALFTAATDMGLGALAAGGRYSLSWYATRVEIITTASIVLVFLLAEIARLYRRAVHIASIDSLTGVASRRAGFEYLERILELGMRNSMEIAVVMADVDHFKLFNDRYGHAAGDACLRGVADALRVALRSSDVVARYGGEEFLCILPGASPQVAGAIAERMRTAVDGLSIPHHDSEWKHVTASFGVCYGRCSEVTANGIVSAADAALYEAKQSGRNRCIVAAPAGFLREGATIVSA
jgi:diguanylate cyclase (GGDEF)-like protein